MSPFTSTRHRLRSALSSLAVAHISQSTAKRTGSSAYDGGFLQTHRLANACTVRNKVDSRMMDTKPMAANESHHNVLTVAASSHRCRCQPSSNAGSVYSSANLLCACVRCTSCHRLPCCSSILDRHREKWCVQMHRLQHGMMEHAGRVTCAGAVMPSSSSDAAAISSSSCNRIKLVHCGHQACADMARNGFGLAMFCK
jgi:hypothetical protein